MSFIRRFFSSKIPASSQCVIDRVNAACAANREATAELAKAIERNPLTRTMDPKARYAEIKRIAHDGGRS